MMDLAKKVEEIRKKDLFSQKISLIVGFVFLFLYLVSIDNIVFSQTDFSISLVDNWKENMFKQRVSFLWEPIVLLTFGVGSFFVSIPNIVLGSLLGFLVYLNVLVSMFLYRMPKTCSIKPEFKGILGFLPATLTGFACCAPTFLLALGPLATASLTVFFVEIRPFLIPLSIILMFWSVLTMSKKIPNFE